MLKIIQKRKIWLSLSSVMVAASIAALSVWGLDFGIDFTGGSLLEIRFSNERPSVDQMQKTLTDLDLGSLIVQPVGEKSLVLRFQDTTEEKHREISEKISEIKISDQSVRYEEIRYDSIGPSVGQELKQKSVYSLFIILIAIIIYIAWAFRKVSKPIASWKYGLAAIIALFHDVLIVLGVFAFLGEFYSVEINSTFVAAILTVLGYSVNDTIVVFDRIRENLPKSEEDFENTINTSINQTLIRSINTSFTTLLALVSIFFFGGDTIKDFVLALSIGIFVGTYSSIFLASPILVVWEKMKSKS